MAREVDRSEWEKDPGRLEAIFVETVAQDPNSGLRPVMS
jgi:hypothetical protein